MNHLLVATDGSEHALRAVELAGEIALCFDAKVTVLHAVPDLGTVVPAELASWAGVEDVYARRHIFVEAGHHIAADAEKQLRAAGVKRIDVVVKVGNPAAMIVETTRERNVDLIVMGRRGLGNLGGLLQGSVSHKVSHLADASVVTVK